MEQKRNEFREVKDRYGKTKHAVVLDIEGKAFFDNDLDIDFMYSEESDRKHARKMLDEGTGNFYGVRATAKVILPQGGYIQSIGELHSGGLYGIEHTYNDKQSENYLKEQIKEQVEELKDILKKLNIRYDKASVNISIE